MAASQNAANQRGSSVLALASSAQASDLVRALARQHDVAGLVDQAGHRGAGGVLDITGEHGNGQAPGLLRRAA